MKRHTYFLRTVAALLLAGLTFASCTKEEYLNGTFSMTVNATKSGKTTKDLALDGTTLNAKWKDGEQVEVYKGASHLGTLTVTDVTGGGANAVLSGDNLSGDIAVDDELTLKFLSADYAAQDGTLEYIAAHCDYAVATVSVSAVSGGSVSTTDALFENRQAIVKFTLKDWSGAAIGATSLTVSDGTTDYTVTPAEAIDTFTVALPDINGGTLTLTASDGSTNYFFAKEGVTFANSQYYAVGVKMCRLVDLSAIDPSSLPQESNWPNHKYYTASDGDALTGTLPSEVELNVPAGATVTLAGMTHHAGEYFHGLQCLGTATLILAAGTTNDLTRGNEWAYQGIILNWGGDATLTIDGTGTLIASGGNRYAGIGGNYYYYDKWSGDSEGNHIVITGGIITATGGSCAPGIGASANGYCGNITINGGTVTATGGNGDGGACGAGIGTASDESKCGTITFNGGTTVATGSSDYGNNYYGIGVGAGNSCRCGNIYFNNGVGGCSVTAYGGVSGVSSGSGYWSVYIDGVESDPWDDPFVYPIPQE